MVETMHICACATHRHTCSNGHDHKSHGELPYVEDASNTSNDCHHGEADDGNPEDGHEEGAHNSVPLAVLRAVWNGPREGYHKGEREDKEDPLEDKLHPSQLALLPCKLNIWRCGPDCRQTWNENHAGFFLLNLTHLGSMRAIF